MLQGRRGEWKVLRLSVVQRSLTRKDGHHLWETEAKVDKDSVKNNSLVVEIPPYRNQRISSPVQVDFYVCNGKRKRSQCQTFTFLPPNVPIIKTEPNDEYDSLGTARLSMHSKPFYSRPRPTPIMTLTNPDDCLVVAYSKCFPNSPDHAAPPGPVVTPIQETSGRPNLAHPASPDHNSPLGMLHSQGSPNHLNSPGPHGYHTIYDSSSPSSSPVSQPSTPGGTEDSPFVQAYSPGPGQTHTGESSPSLLTDDDASPPSMAITVKREPQELDQMYLDDGNSDMSSHPVIFSEH
ncbi:hypothetical protein KUCAC02_013538 [Chaenocephalus aceratus]|uniref:Uncharacterized protein n=1 Tax=Chaenocephalus aceratus TaxID=36190 RepID=A0ACB9WCM4_CHAAC|nr:hypothetical protein KUCAC02_013538 [Chaenocephalus aceratus]